MPFFFLNENKKLQACESERCDRTEDKTNAMLAEIKSDPNRHTFSILLIFPEDHPCTTINGPNHAPATDVRIRLTLRALGGGEFDANKRTPGKAKMRQFHYPGYYDLKSLGFIAPLDPEDEEEDELAEAFGGMAIEEEGGERMDDEDDDSLSNGD